MSHIKRSALVHYSPAEMFALVNDIDAYSKFLPWCKSSRIVSQSGNEMIASVEIARGALNKTFTTKNTLKSNKRIQIALVDGPIDPDPREMIHDDAGLGESLAHRID